MARRLRSLGGSLAGSLGGSLSDRAGGTPSLAGLGASLLHHWEVPASTDPNITLVSGACSQLNDRVAGAHMLQGTAGNRPIYSAQYAPGNKPFLEMTLAAHYMLATISIAAANRAGLYVFGRFNGILGSLRYMSHLYNNGVSNNVRVTYLANEKYEFATNFTSGFQNPVINTPYLDQDWHLWAIRPASTGAHAQVDGVETSNALTGSSTLLAHNRATIGHESATLSEGRVALVLVVDDPTDDKDAIIRNYVAAEWRDNGANLFIKAGQSNAYNVTDTEMGTIGGYVMKGAAWGGQDLAVKWAPGSRCYNALVQTINRTPAMNNVFIWWVQGESDAQNPAYAPAYAANMVAFADAVETATGRSDIFWIDTLLHTSLTGCAPGDLDLVNDGKTAFVATRPTRSALLDPTPNGSLSDGVHWNAALRSVMAGLARAVVIANP